MGFIWYIIIGIIAGFLAGKIMRGGGFGLIINLLLGILGGVLGGWVFALFGLAASGLIGSLITSTVGAILVLCIIRKSKFPQNPKRSVRFSGKGTKRSVQKRKARNTQKAETKVL